MQWCNTQERINFLQWKKIKILFFVIMSKFETHFTYTHDSNTILKPHIAYEDETNLSTQSWYKKIINLWISESSDEKNLDIKGRVSYKFKVKTEV